MGNDPTHTANGPVDWFIDILKQFHTQSKRKIQALVRQSTDD